MVTLQEWMQADDFTVFENIDNHKRITKFFLKQNLSNVEKTMIQQYASKGEGPTRENVHRIQDLIAATLENFEIVEIKKIKQTDEGVPIEDKAHGHLPSQDNKGKFCFKCGLQKENTQVVEKEGEFIRMCKECLGI